MPATTGDGPGHADEGGFTLTELLVVIVILGILSGVVVFAVGNLAGSSSQAGCKDEFRTVQVAVEAYKQEMGGYPNGTGGSAVLPVTDGDPSTQNAAAPGAELLVRGDTAPNTVASAASSGPWLKDVPSLTGHYSISVSNDGSGIVTVEDPAGTPLGTSAASCPAN